MEATASFLTSDVSGLCMNHILPLNTFSMRDKGR